MADEIDSAGVPSDLRSLGMEEIGEYKEKLAAAGLGSWAFYYPFLLLVERGSRHSHLLWTEDAGSLCLFVLRTEKRAHLDLYAPPIPFNEAVLRRCLERVSDFNRDRSARIYWIDNADAAAVEESGLEVRLKEYEYCYRPENFLDLSGRAFRTLRRNVELVQKTVGVAVRPYLAGDAPACLELLGQWEAGQGKKYKTLRDRAYTRACFSLASQLPDRDLRGEVVLIDGQVGAFAFGGEIRPGLGCFLVAKADPELKGMSYFLRHHFLLGMADCPVVNDSSDMGSEGLRQLKQSLRPLKMHSVFAAKQV